MQCGLYILHKMFKEVQWKCKEMKYNSSFHCKPNLTISYGDSTLLRTQQCATACAFYAQCVTQQTRIFSCCCLDTCRGQVPYHSNVIWLLNLNLNYWASSVQLTTINANTNQKIARYVRGRVPRPLCFSGLVLPLKWHHSTISLLRLASSEIGGYENMGGQRHPHPILLDPYTGF